MTDAPSSSAASSNRPLSPADVPINAVPSFDGAADETTVEQEEDGLIKCICGFSDDDGWTVYCEKCKTWQHVICYYPTNEAPDVHYCADCEPREIDVDAAIQRQIGKRDQAAVEVVGQMSKRQVGRAHRRKIKDASVVSQSNGQTLNDSNDHALVNGQPIKKTKKHRSSHSVSQNASMAEYRPSQRSPLRAALLDRLTSHEFPGYTEQFLHLYDYDPGASDLRENTFKSLTVTNALSAYLHDIEVSSKFMYPCQPFRPVQVSDHRSEDPSVTYHGRHPRFHYVTTEEPVYAQQYIGELNGDIGLRDEYTTNPMNRWSELHHPLPFIYFASELPIYVDVRKQGNILRYVRRSCRPTMSFKTVILNGADYHFCLFASQDIPAGTELTVPWQLELSIMNMLPREMTSKENAYVSAWISNVFANCGDCACDGQACCLERYDQRNKALVMTETGMLVNGTKRRKTKQALSSVLDKRSHSRTSSISAKPQEDEESLDSRSTCGSVNSKGRSRDQSPTDVQQHFLDMTEREKRKIAAAERKFEQMELELEHSLQRKRKRHNIGPGRQAQAAAASASKVISSASPLASHPISQASRTFADPGMSRRGSQSSRLSDNERNSIHMSNRSSSRKSSAAYTPTVPSPLSRTSCFDVATQTPVDLDTMTESTVSLEPLPKRRLRHSFNATRLLRLYHEEHVKLREKNNRIAKDKDAPKTCKVEAATNEDVEMVDADQDVETKIKVEDVSDESPKLVRVFDGDSNPQGSLVSTHLESTLPISASPPVQLSTVSRNSPAEPHAQTPLKLQPTPLDTSTPTLSLLPSFNSTPTTLTPTSSLFHSIDTPSPSKVVQPSPVKKKLSLNDYMSRRNLLAAKLDRGETRGGLSSKLSSTRVGDDKKKEPGVMPAAGMDSSRRSDGGNDTPSVAVAPSYPKQRT